MPAKQFTGMAINHKRQYGPAIASSPDTTQVCRPALVWGRSHRRQDLHPWPEANRAFLHLPTSKLEDPLHGVLVEAQEGRHCAISERGFFKNHLLDRFGKAL